jgi:lipopolysaccharide biosynthesis regulator YciM
MSGFNTEHHKQQNSELDDSDSDKRLRYTCQSCGGALDTQLEFCPGCLGSNSHLE